MFAAQRDHAGPIEQHRRSRSARIELDLEGLDRREGIDMVAHRVLVGKVHLRAGLHHQHAGLEIALALHHLGARAGRGGADRPPDLDRHHCAGQRPAAGVGDADRQRCGLSCARHQAGQKHRQGDRTNGQAHDRGGERRAWRGQKPSIPDTRGFQPPENRAEAAAIGCWLLTVGAGSAPRVPVPSPAPAPRHGAPPRPASSAPAAAALPTGRPASAGRAGP